MRLAGEDTAGGHFGAPQVRTRGVSVSGVRGVSVSGANGVIGVSVIGVSGVAQRKGHGCTLLPAGSAASASSASAASAAAVSQKRKKRSHTQCFWPFLSHDGFPPNPGFESFRGRSSFFESKDGQEEEVDTNMRSEPTGGGPMHGRRVPDPVRRPCCRVILVSCRNEFWQVYPVVSGRAGSGPLPFFLQ